MITKKLICIRCPLGCQLEADVDGTEVLAVRGNTCPRGAEYAQKELTNPTRIVTTTVRVEGGDELMLPVKTAGDIPKGKIIDCIQALKNLKIQAPVSVGDVIFHNVAETGVDMVATKTIEKMRQERERQK